MTFDDAIKLIAQREVEALSTIREISQSMDVDSSTFWTRVAQTQIMKGFESMRQALIYPGEDD